MHKFITIFLSSILTIVHAVFFLGLGVVLFLGGASLPDTGFGQLELFLGIVGSAVLYVVFAGITSVLIRINQNLETISAYMAELATGRDEL